MTGSDIYVPGRYIVIVYPGVFVSIHVKYDVYTAKVVARY